MEGFRVVLFDLKEVAAITDIGWGALESWVTKGWLEPAQRGRRGRITPHRLSAAQVLAIVFLSDRADKHGVRHISRMVVIEALETAAKLSDDFFRRWVADEDQLDAHAQERAARNQAQAALVPLEDWTVPALVDTRLERLHDAIKAKLSAESAHREWLLKAQPLKREQKQVKRIK
jgi:hypothetical protein